MPDLISRKAAREAGLRRYFTGKTCSRGHLSERYVGSAHCVECHSEQSSKWHSDRPEYLKQYLSEWRAANPEYGQQWARDNNERMRELWRRWGRGNPAKSLHRFNRRYCAKLRAIPAWCDMKEVEAVYLLAAEMTASTGIPHHVDHIIPLRGRTVCGLHVPENLQVIPASENMSKGNKF